MSDSVAVADPLGAKRGSEVRRPEEAAEFLAPDN
jgi:hypothetical protein